MFSFESSWRVKPGLRLLPAFNGTLIDHIAVRGTAGGIIQCLSLFKPPLKSGASEGASDVLEFIRKDSAKIE